MMQCLVKDEKKRATVAELQQHTWVTRFASKVRSLSSNLTNNFPSGDQPCGDTEASLQICLNHRATVFQLSTISPLPFAISTTL